MRTTVDIAEPLLRQARARAALEGLRMQDVVNRALRLYLGMEEEGSLETTLPERIGIEPVGRFRLPVVRSSHPGQAAGVEMLKAGDDEEDEERHDAVFGR